MDRERAYMYAGQALAHILRGTSPTLLPPFDPQSPTPRTGPGDEFIAAVAATVVAVSYDVDIAVHQHWNEADDLISDHLGYIYEGGHRDTSFEVDPAGKMFTNDPEWVAATFETLVLHHWTAVASVADQIADDPTLPITTITAMLRVVGPSTWGHHLMPDDGQGHTHDTVFLD